MSAFPALFGLASSLALATTASAQVTTFCDRAPPSQWGLSPTVDVLYYQGPCNQKLVPGKEAMVRVYLNWKKFEGKMSVTDYDVTVTLSVPCKGAPSFPVNVKRPDLHSQDELRAASNSVNFFGCDLNGVQDVTATVKFDGSDVTMSQTRAVSHMRSAQGIRTRVLFPTVGSWSGGVPQGAIASATKVLADGKVFTLQNLPIGRVTWDIASGQLAVVEPHLQEDPDLQLGDDEEWKVVSAPCSKYAELICRTFVESDVAFDDELSPERWLYELLRTRYASSHLVVAVVPTDFQGDWTGVTIRNRGLGLGASPNTLDVANRTPAVVLFREDADAETVAHELGHYLGLPHHDGTLVGGFTREVEGFKTTSTSGSNKSATEGNGELGGTRQLLSLMSDGKPGTSGPITNFIMNPQFEVLQDDLDGDPIPSTAALWGPSRPSVRLAMNTDGPGAERSPLARLFGRRAPAGLPVVVSGVIQADGARGRLGPVEWAPGPVDAPGADGSASVRFVDAAGQVLSSVAVDTEARVDFSNGNEGSGATRFSVTTPMPDGARTLQLVSSTGAVLAERSGGGALPAVRVVAPGDGEVWAPGDPVRWEGDDPGGRGLRFSAYYSRDGGAEWLPLAVGVGTDSLVLAGLTPGPDPVLVVAATDGFNVTADTAAFRVRVPPAPLGHSPGAGDTVSVGAGVQVYFNTDLTSEAGDGGALLLLDGAGQLVEGDTRYDAEARSLAFEPARPLVAGTEYTAFLPSGLQDRFGNRAGSDYTWRFVVEPDVERPAVERAVPREDAVAIPLDAVVQVRFSEAMDPESVGGLRVGGPDGSEVQGTVSYDPETRTAVFVPTDPLEAASTYRVTVPAEASDRSGNGLAAEYAWTFATTGAAGPLP